MVRRSSTRPAAEWHSLRVLLPLAVLCFSSTASAAAAVLGIDLGTNFIKAAIVKPGIPLDIVLTKDSKRKESAAIGFKPDKNGPVELGKFPERVYGGDALALAGRFPGDVYSNLKPLLALDVTDTTPVEQYMERFPGLQVTTKDESFVAFKSAAFSDKEQPWLVEELLAMQLKNVRGYAETLAGKGIKITNAVITIPPFYTADERRAVQRAADLAGITVMGLITDGLAVGIDYSLKREFPNISRGNKAELHLIFDMGATSTTATVLRCQSRDVKDVGRYNKTLQEVSVMGTGWDKTLGGNALNGLILDNMVSEFTSKPDIQKARIPAYDLKRHGRTANKLWREAERARQVLSANNEVRSSFEELYQGHDFSTKLTRTQFEELAAPFADRIEATVKQALDAAKISVDDLTSIVLHGGAVRTPFVTKRLSDFVGKSAELRSNVNADESAAFGAALKAASLSASFRVREIRDAEAAVYPAGISQLQNGKSRQQQIFVSTSSSGTPKQVQFKDKTDFDFTIYQKAGDVVRPIATVQAKNVTAGVKALNDQFGCKEEEVQTNFVLRLSPVDGIPEVVNGAVSCSVNETAKKAGIVDSVKGLFGGKKDQEPLKDASSESEEATSSATSSSSSAAASATGTVNGSEATTSSVPTTRTESINIEFVTVPQGLPVPSKEDFKRMKERLAAFDRSDKARLAREEAFNTLEGFTYRARDLLSDATFEQFSTESVRSQLSELLSSTSDWLYGEGASAPSDVLKERLSQFKKLVDPVQKRQQEAKALPENIKRLQTVLGEMNTLIDNIAGDLEKAASSASSAAEQAASTISSAATPESSANDDPDNLEEPDSSSAPSTSTTETPSILTPYTKEDLADVRESYESVVAWLKEKVDAQEKLKPYEDPVLTNEELENKGGAVSRVMHRMFAKKNRPPPPPPPKKGGGKKTKSKAKKAKAKASSVPNPEPSAASAAHEPMVLEYPEDMKDKSEEEMQEWLASVMEQGKARSGRPVVEKVAKETQSVKDEL